MFQLSKSVSNFIISLPFTKLQQFLFGDDILIDKEHYELNNPQFRAPVIKILLWLYIKKHAEIAAENCTFWSVTVLNLFLLERQTFYKIWMFIDYFERKISILYIKIVLNIPTFKLFSLFNLPS